MPIDPRAPKRWWRGALRIEAAHIRFHAMRQGTMRAIRALPQWLRRPLTDLAKGILYFGRSRFCPVCGRSSRRFRPSGAPSRRDAGCPRCGSLERHRFLWVYLTRRSPLFDGRERRVLHIAPEPCLLSRFQSRLGPGYVTADLEDPGAMVRMDVEAVPYRDETFDVVACSHVLEHVADDRQALRELHRVLKRDGWAILLVPITVGRTIEDPTLDDPKRRRELFGQDDHVRAYGPDYVERLREAGFRVEVTEVGALGGEAEAVRMGLTKASGELFCCWREVRREA